MDEQPKKNILKPIKTLLLEVLEELNNEEIKDFCFKNRGVYISLGKRVKPLSKKIPLKKYGVNYYYEEDWNEIKKSIKQWIKENIPNYKICYNRSCEKYNSCIYKTGRQCPSCGFGLKYFCKDCGTFYDDDAFEHKTECDQKMKKIYEKNPDKRYIYCIRKMEIVCYSCSPKLTKLRFEYSIQQDIKPIKPIEIYDDDLIKEKFKNGDFIEITKETFNFEDFKKFITQIFWKTNNETSYQKL